MFKTLLFLAFWALQRCQAEVTLVLELDRGEIQGTIQEVDGQRVNFYEGIPYGRAKRFEKPDKARSWRGTYNATGYRFACPQAGIPIGTDAQLDSQGSDLNQTQFSSEDCLFLNVWSPASNGTSSSASSSLAVMVWIPSGTSGTIFSQALNGQTLASLGQVILVTVSYRLGALGFLYGDDGDEPGNLGLYDQILALKWIQKNIGRFGGDPEQVTLFGPSQGYVGLHLLSGESRGLFRRAILQGNSPISPAGAEDAKVAFATKSRLLGAMTGCGERSKKRMIRCLKNVSIDSLVNASAAMETVGLKFTPIFGEDDLLKRSPVETLLAGRLSNRNIDLLFGVDEAEASSTLEKLFPGFVSGSNSSLTVDVVNQTILQILKLYRVPYSEQVLQYYLSNSSSDNQTQLNGVPARLLDDLLFTCPTVLLAEQIGQSQPGNSYFSYRLEAGSRKTSELLFGNFSNSTESGNGTNSTLNRDIITAWTSFAKTGNPGTMGTTQWTSAFTSNSFVTQYMRLDSSGSYQMNSEGAYEATCSGFWKEKFMTMYRFGSDD